MPIGVTIRPALPGDAEAIAQIVRESYARHAASHIPFDMPLYHEESHLDAMLDPDTRWIVLQEEARRVGVAMWRMLPGIAHLHLLFVSGECQGKGYGRLLLKHHQTESKTESPETKLYTLHCLRDSQWAVRFYRHQGYSMYEPGDEYKVTDLYVWIDACRRHDNGWPLRADKALFYKKAH